MLKVVVIEDEELVRRGIVMAVDWASVDCKVVGEASNGEAGLEEIRRLRPDIVVTDIRMPRMDGLEMLRRLREEGCGVSVILLTAYSDFSYAQTALKLGAVDYLLKPFHDGELEAAVQRIAERGRVRTKPGDFAEISSKNRYVTGAVDYINANYGDPELGVSAVARSVDISEGHLSHLFKKETGYTLTGYYDKSIADGGYTLTGYITACRMHMAMHLLRDRRCRVSEAAERVGYRDIAYFSSTFKKFTGSSPSEFQNS